MFQLGVETNLAKIQNHNTVQGYNSEENPFKIMLFLCFRRMLLRSATFDSHPAARGRSWIPLGNWRHVVSDEQFLTSPFLPARFYLFSHQLNFLGPPGPGALSPATPPLSVGLLQVRRCRFCSSICFFITEDSHIT